MNLRLAYGLCLSSFLILCACESKVVNQTIYNNGTSNTQQTASSSTTAQAFTAPSASSTPPSTPIPLPVPSTSLIKACPTLDIRADGSWNFPRPDKTPRILKPGEYQLFPDGSAKITKPGEPDTGQVVRPVC